MCLSVCLTVCLFVCLLSVCRVRAYVHMPEGHVCIQIV